MLVPDGYVPEETKAHSASCVRGNEEVGLGSKPQAEKETDPITDPILEKMPATTVASHDETQC